MATGQPTPSPNATTSSGSCQGLAAPGHALRRRRPRRRERDEILSPMTSIASGGGPTKVTPRAVMARAKSVFSEKKP